MAAPQPLALLPHHMHGKERDLCCCLCAGPLRSIKRYVDIGLFSQRKMMAPYNHQNHSNHPLNAMLETSSALYDPLIVSEASTLWLQEFRVLAFDVTNNSAYVSGCGMSMPNGKVRFYQSPHDAPSALMLERPCYDQLSNFFPVFPFHWCCWEIFSLVVYGSKDTEQIDIKKLYGVMYEEIEPTQGVRLTIKYGESPPSNSNKWQSKSGQEYFVTHPMSTGPNKHLFYTLLGPQFSFPSSPHDFRPHIRSDPFRALPLELASKIAYYLPIASLFDFMQASGAAHMLLRDDCVFWGNIIKREMPWFFEIHDFLRDKLAKGRDVKGMLRWAERATTPELGLEDWMLGIANRRRIWFACEDLKGVLFESRV